MVFSHHIQGLATGYQAGGVVSNAVQEEFSASAPGSLDLGLSVAPGVPEQTQESHQLRARQHPRSDPRAPYLRPLPVAAGHVNSSDVLEELLGRDEVRQTGEELSHVDEVHTGQDILVKPQKAQRCAEQEFLAVSAEHVPHAAR